MLSTSARAQFPVDQANPPQADMQFVLPTPLPFERPSAANSGNDQAAIFQPTGETLPAAALPAATPAARPDEAIPVAAPRYLGLDEVLESVRRSYPLLAAVLQERGIAAGEQRSSRGAFDLNVQAENMTGALGYYQTNRAALRAEQNTLPGGKVWGAYRIGRGSFEPWYLERQTNDGGEFRVGYSQSLLQGLAIDKRRTAMQKADLGVAAAEPSIDKQRIYFLEYAAINYWKWVACGHWYLINRNLLQLAEDRVAGIETRIQRGILPEIERLDNRRLIVTRQAKLIEADRKFQQAAVELSLYLRDASGAPLLPPADRLPSFPEPSKPDDAHFDTDVQTALFFRPEPRYLRIQREKLAVELNYARNLTLPQLDAVVDTAKDVGGPTSPKNDKGPFQMEAGLLFNVPMQRRLATGQVRTAEAAIAQVRAQEQYAVERVSADVRYALAGLKTAYDEYLRAQEATQLAAQMEVAEDTKFDLGNSNILFVNLREQATADARMLVVDSLAKYFIAAAEYRAALGLDAEPGRQP
jgi:outer membrane protein TolC